MSQFERLTYIDRAARESGGVTVEDVAHHFEVSPRQVKRDIEYLRCRLNAPIEYFRGELRYRYTSEFDGLRFADEQALVFHSLVRSLIQSEHYIPVFSDEILESIAARISRDYLPVSERISYHLPVSGRLDIETFTTICQGMLTRKRLDIVYVKSSGERSERRIEAERLINYTGRWYMVAFDLLRKDFRVFHLSRIESVALSTKDCTGTGTPSRERALDRYLKAGFGIFMGTKVENAVIRFTGQAASVVAEQIWHPAQKIEHFGEGETACTVLSIPVAAWTELLGRVLSFGASAEPLQPEGLRVEWKQTISEMAKLAAKPITKV